MMQSPQGSPNVIALINQLYPGLGNLFGQFLTSMSAQQPAFGGYGGYSPQFIQPALAQPSFGGIPAFGGGFAAPQAGAFAQAGATPFPGVANSFQSGGVPGVGAPVNANSRVLFTPTIVQNQTNYLPRFPGAPPVALNATMSANARLNVNGMGF